ncbi:MAG: hypothetical protein ACI4TF_13760 [Oliverpabstia sp.]
MAGTNDKFMVGTASVLAIKQAIAAEQSQMISLLNQFEKEVKASKSYWESSFTDSFRTNAAGYIKNVRTKQETLTKNLETHLSVIISTTEKVESNLTKNAELFDH